VEGVWGNREVPPAVLAWLAVREADPWRGSGGSGRFPQQCAPS
jgi:hypothetical protein